MVTVVVLVAMATISEFFVVRFVLDLSDLQLQCDISMFQVESLLFLCC